jgi:hypothetical protein
MDGGRTPPGRAPFETAFERWLPAMTALRAEEVIPVNLSIPDAAARALGVQPAVLDFRARIANELPTIDADLAKELGELAMALSHANTLYRVATRASDPVPSLSEEGMKLRELLFSDAGALVKRGLVDGQALRGYKGAVGYRNLAFDLQMLVQLFRSCPESVRACSAAGPQASHGPKSWQRAS